MGFARPLACVGVLACGVLSLKPLSAALSEDSQISYDQGVRVSTPVLAALCDGKFDERTEEALATLPLDIVHLHFFGALAEKLANNYACQTILIDRVKGNKEDYIATLRELVKEPAGYDTLLGRLMVEGACHLDAHSFFGLLDLSTRWGNYRLTGELVKVLLEASKARPEELPAAIHEAIARENLGLVIDLWNSAADSSRTCELLSFIMIEGHRYQWPALHKAFSKSFGDSYEDDYGLQEPIKRQVTSIRFSGEWARSLYHTYLEGLDGSQIDEAEDQQAMWLKEAEKVLSAFIRDDANPYYHKAQLDMLIQHLTNKIKKQAPAMLTIEQLRDECQRWKEQFERYRIPLVMKTS